MWPNKHSPYFRLPMVAELHRLCDICQRLKFDLRTLRTCSTSRCVDGVIAGQHTTRVSHQPDFRALESAVQYGCHLCSLICSGLEQNPERKGQLAHGNEIKQPGEISLVYFLEKETGTENIIAHHEERWATLHLADKPSTNCANPLNRDLGVGPPQFMVVP